MVGAGGMKSGKAQLGLGQWEAKGTSEEHRSCSSLALEREL